MTEAEYRVAFELRKLPQRSDHFMLLHGPDRAAADALAEQGLVVSEAGKYGQRYRLSGLGRMRLLAEFINRNGVRPSPAPGP